MSIISEKHESCVSTIQEALKVASLQRPGKFRAFLVSTVRRLIVGRGYIGLIDHASVSEGWARYGRRGRMFATSREAGDRSRELHRMGRRAWR